ncbi:hypothetical protein [Hymenobacter sp. YC55]|uniref:hypothetical protein n=1 Tax=Hymenobacter sp. YC55 TaxID=3034019 RepID=UPI0023F9CC51|nr:hypothetical protein [Hymenobacter sp. YC55]MDF7810688.1 hypothetical protein [Hymenobacter sp. YC55]
MAKQIRPSGSGGGGTVDTSAIVAEQAALRQLLLQINTTAGPSSDGKLYIERYRQQGDSDVQVWRKAVNAMNALGVPLYGTAGIEYKFNGETVVHIGGYWKVYYEGCFINQDHGQQYRRLGFDQFGNYTAQDVTPDLSYPTPAALGPFRGAAFVFCTEIQNRVNHGARISNYRFAFVHLSQDNSPIYVNCDLSYNDFGVFFYQGAQCPQLIDTRATQIGCLFYAAGTCHTLESPYKYLDNYFCDKATLKNVMNYPQLSRFKNLAQDKWTVKSIIRPRALSYAANNQSPGHTYNLPEGEIQEDHPDIQCSGRIAFLPFRNYRGCFDFIVMNLDQRDEVDRPSYVINTWVKGLKVQSLAAEGLENVPKSVPLFKIGAVTQGTAAVEHATLGIGNDRIIFQFSGRGVGNNGGGDIGGKEEFLNLKGTRQEFWQLYEQNRSGIAA